MRIPWKVLGVAGAAGVVASGAVVARRRRPQRDYEPDELRARLHDRLAQVQGGEPAQHAAADGRGPAESAGA